MSTLPWFHGSYEEIAARVRVGSGSAAGERAQALWSQTKDVVLECDAVINGTARRIAGAWAGPAADEFHTVLSSVSAWVVDASSDATATTAAVVAQGSHADELRRLLPQPPPTGGRLDWVQLRQTAATADAQRLAGAYAQQTLDNQNALSLWSTPPTVSVDVPSPRTTLSATAPVHPAPGRAAVSPASAGAGASSSRAEGRPRTSPVGPGAAEPDGGQDDGSAVAAVGGAEATRLPEDGTAATRTGSTDVGRVAADGVGALAVPTGVAGAGSIAAGRGSSPPVMGRAAAVQLPPVDGLPEPGADAASEPGADGSWQTGSTAASDLGPAAGRTALDERGGAAGLGSRDASDAGPDRSGSGDLLGDAVGTERTPGVTRSVAGHGGVDALPPGVGGRGSLPSPPALPGGSASTSGWRDVVAGERAVSPAPAGERSGIYPPMTGGSAGGQEISHRRPAYLLDDSGAFADDRWFTPAVITPDDPLPGAPAP